MGKQSKNVFGLTISVLYLSPYFRFPRRTKPKEFSRSTNARRQQDDTWVWANNLKTSLGFQSAFSIWALTFDSQDARNLRDSRGLRIIYIYFIYVARIYFSTRHELQTGWILALRFCLPGLTMMIDGVLLRVHIWHIIAWGIIYTLSLLMVQLYCSWCLKCEVLRREEIIIAQMSSYTASSCPGKYGIIEVVSQILVTATTARTWSWASH